MMKNSLPKRAMSNASNFGWQQLVVPVLYGVVLAMLLLESYKYLGFWQNNLGVGSHWLVGAALVGFLLLRLRVTRFDSWLFASVKKLNVAAFFVAVALLIVGSYAERELYANFLYAHLHLEVHALPLLVAFTFGVAMIFPLKQHSAALIHKAVLFCAGLALLATAVLIRTKSYDIYTTYFGGTGRDDNFIENLQFVIFLASSLLATYLGAMYKKTKMPLWIVAGYLLGGIALLFVAGEEISWGQRLIGFDAPEAFQTNNLQLETNLHNSSLVFGYVYRVYIVLTAYASFSWMALYIVPLLKMLKKTALANRLKKQLEHLHLVVTRPHLVSFFFTSFSIFYLQRVKHWFWISEYEEFAELMMALGVLLFLLGRFREARRLE